MLQELCIRRPVMTILLMVSFLFAGLFAYRLLPVAAVPRVDYPTISVSASLPGASPETMAASVASILERQFSAIAGVTSINSTSSLGQTQITLQFDLARGIDAAAADVQSAISSATRRLPSAMPSPPSYRKVNPADQPILFLALTSSVEQLSSVDRLAQSLILPQLSILPGVAQVSIFGSQKYAVRIRVDLDKLAARGLTMADLSSAISSANSNTPVGSINEGGRTIILDATGPLARAADFAAIPIDVRGGTAIHLSDVASVIDSVENLQSASWLNDTRGIVLAVQRQPDANTVEVVDKVKALIPSIRAGLPGTIDLQVMNDRSQSIRNSVADVTRSLLISGGLVVLVIFLFLGSLRATIIPALALPVSIIGTFSGMWLFGHSIDNISLLALTLCVGFVVDDAIVVLENVTRHAEEGTKPFEAAIIGSREVGFTILSMTLSLVAVFLPVLLMGGVVGRVFNEFGVDITIAILISGVVSLTLTPMLAARLVKVKPKSEKAGGVFSWFARGFDAITRAYAWSVRQTLRATWLMLLVALGTLAGTIYLYVTIPKGFFPQEDNSLLMANISGPDDSSYDWMLAHLKQVSDAVAKDPDVTTLLSSVNGGGSARLFVTLRDRPARKTAMADVINRLRGASTNVPGVRVFFQAIQSISLGGGGGGGRSAYQYALQSGDLTALRAFAPKLEERLHSVPGLTDVSSDLQLNARTAFVTVDRERAALLGLNVDDVRRLIYAAFGSTQVSTILAPEDAYSVILEADPAFAASGTLLRKLAIKASNGQLVPLDTLAKIEQRPASLSVSHLNQLPVVTLSFGLAPGLSLGDATKMVEAAAREIGMPSGITASFQGQAQLFQAALGNQGLLLLVATLVVYIVLGILYESFLHPLTIISGLPSAGVGALLALKVYGLDLSIIAVIGLILLIGIVKKNSIMLVDFALQRMAEGFTPKDAIVDAARLRFRPIMMTTFAAVLGTLPIAIGIGAGSELRQPLGIAVVGGLMVSQLLTLYITPAMFVAMESLRRIGKRRPAGHDLIAQEPVAVKAAPAMAHALPEAAE